MNTSEIDSLFKNKKGQLTRYALSCGYLEVFELANARAILEMPSPSSGYIRVSAFDHDSKERLTDETFHKLTDARKAFVKAKKLVRHLASCK